MAIENRTRINKDLQEIQDWCLASRGDRNGQRARRAIECRRIGHGNFIVEKIGVHTLSASALIPLSKIIPAAKRKAKRNHSAKRTFK